MDENTDSAQEAEVLDMLTGAEVISPAIQTQPQTQTQQQAQTQTVTSATAAVPLTVVPMTATTTKRRRRRTVTVQGQVTRRGPGRPRKDAASAAPKQAQAQVRRGPGRPRKEGTRGPGRPRKDATAAPAVAKVKATRNRRSPGVKSQEQIRPGAHKFYEKLAKEKGVKSTALKADILNSYAERRGAVLG